jgi:hypothetical protein
VAHLVGRLVGKGDRQYRERGEPFLADQPGNPVRKDACLTRACPSHDQERPPDVGDGLELRRVQPLQEGLVPVMPRVASFLGLRRQCPIPTPWERWSDLPSVSSAGATITSAF